MIKKPKLTLMLGNSHSGKSTWVAKNKGNAIVVCPDAIRKIVFGHQFHLGAEDHIWALTKSMIRLLLDQGKNVILDATNLKYGIRDQYWHIANEYDAKTEIIWIRTPVETCLKRNETDEIKQVPTRVITSMDVMLEEPLEDEADSVRTVWTDRIKKGK